MGRGLQLLNLQCYSYKNLAVGVTGCSYCRAQLGNRDVAPVAALQSQPRECQMHVTVLALRNEHPVKLLLVG